jgi:hypothetical protein
MSFILSSHVRVLGVTYTTLDDGEVVVDGRADDEADGSGERG